VHTAGKLFIWGERNLGRYEHVRACRERACARRARKNPPALQRYYFFDKKIIFVLKIRKNTVFLAQGALSL
jgi:hypothetical protein